jgi:hypothetical protein
MYARSYEKNGYEEAAPHLPSGYRGTAFEQEPCEEATAPLTEESVPASLLGASGEGAGPLAFLEKLLPLKRLLPVGKGGFFGSLFSDAEDILLLGILLLLLFSKEGDPLCAVAVLVLLISGKT